MEEEYDFYKELFSDASITFNSSSLSVDLEMEPWEVSDLMDSVYPIVHKKVPNFSYKINAYKTYEEEFGGFFYHGVLEIDMLEISKEEISYIKNIIYQTM